MAKRLTRRQWIGALVGICVATTAFWWFFLRAPSPDEVAYMATRALERGDVDTLLKLTMPEEVEKLHLTRLNVRAFLAETIYVDGMPHTLTVKNDQKFPVDQWQYRIQSGGVQSASVHYPLPMAVNQMPSGRWYLALTYLLLNTCGMKDRTLPVQDTWIKYRALCDKYDIRGVRLNTWGYSYYRRSQP